MLSALALSNIAFASEISSSELTNKNVSLGLSKVANSDSSNISEAQLRNELSSISDSLEIGGEIPEGVVPIEVNSIEEAKAILKQNRQIAEDVSSKPIDGKVSGIQPRSFGVRTVTGSIPISSSKLSVTISYEYLWNKKIAKNYFNKVTGVSSALSGLVITKSWEQKGFAANFSSNKTVCDVKVNGILYTHLLFNKIPIKSGDVTSVNVRIANP